ncbi:uncharacterized protein A4U43_C08F8160 [Asparagus officinalis]|nr:uncharacterized protein A4U43_C08F8160 [Asparagus officinalis]
MPLPSSPTPSPCSSPAASRVLRSRLGGLCLVPSWQLVRRFGSGRADHGGLESRTRFRRNILRLGEWRPPVPASLRVRAGAFVVPGVLHGFALGWRYRACCLSPKERGFGWCGARGGWRWRRSEEDGGRRKGGRDVGLLGGGGAQAEVRGVSLKEAGFEVGEVVEVEMEDVRLLEEKGEWEVEGLIEERTIGFLDKEMVSWWGFEEIRHERRITEEIESGSGGGSFV